MNIKNRIEKLERASPGKVSSKILQRLHVGCENLPDFIPKAQFTRLFNEMWKEDTD